jgi:uncharacterized protein (TIGR02588 family)
MTSRRTSGDRGIGRRRTPFEWALLGISLAAILVVTAGLVLSQLLGGGGPADLRVIVADEGVLSSGGRSLEVMVTNVGGTSSQNVIVEVTVAEVTREVDLDLVAKGDTESAVVVVPTDDLGEPTAQVVSYANP